MNPWKETLNVYQASISQMKAELSHKRNTYLFLYKLKTPLAWMSSYVLGYVENASHLNQKDYNEQKDFYFRVLSVMYKIKY